MLRTRWRPPATRPRWSRCGPAAVGAFRTWRVCHNAYGTPAAAMHGRARCAQPVSNLGQRLHARPASQQPVHPCACLPLPPSLPGVQRGVPRAQAGRHLHDLRVRRGDDEQSDRWMTVMAEGWWRQCGSCLAAAGASVGSNGQPRVHLCSQLLSRRWVTTPQYDPANREHVAIVDEIIIGNGLPVSGCLVLVAIGESAPVGGPPITE